MSISLAPAAISLREERQRLRQEHYRGASGKEIARDHAKAVDAALLSLMPAALPKQAWALVALGGYGRGQLSPHSDVDIMILCRRPDKEIEALANVLFYGLWDASLEVGHAVRTVDECLHLADRSLETQTALLDARVIAGREELFADLRGRLEKDLRGKRAERFLDTLWRECQRRHHVYGEAAYRLEPHLKEGQGGLRDFQSILWASAAIGAIDQNDLVRRGLISLDEVLANEAAIEFLFRVRHHLHYLNGRRNDQLFIANQEEVARFFGYTHTIDRLAVERFMRDLYIHLDTIWQNAMGFWEQILDNRASGTNWPGLIEQEDVRLAATGGSLTPDVVLHLFAEAARRRRQVSHAQWRQIRGDLEGAATLDHWSAQARDDFFAILQAGDHAMPLLEAMARCGLLKVYIPEWANIEFLALHEIYHVHTVDHHCLLTVATIAQLAIGGQSDDDILAKQLLAEFREPRALLLAALIHDLGKGEGQDHAEKGARLAQTVGQRIGLSPEEVETVVFLVRRHLLLAQVATRRDIDDHKLILRLANTVGSAERLKLLYILTMADSLATGPGTWSEWKATLVRELFTKVLHILEDGRPASHDAHSHTTEKREAVRAALSTLTNPDEVEAFLNRVPAAYLRAQPVNSIYRHYALLSQSGGGPVRIQVRKLHKAHRYELALSAADHPGLLWRICGVFALHGLNIFEARVYTADDLALDIFQVADAFEPEISGEKLVALQRDIALAVEGRLALGYRLAEKLRHYPPTKNGFPPVGTRVVVDNAASDDYTVVEIFAHDRLGLLYTITRTLSDMHLDIHLAKVSTRAPEAIDAFYVRDLHGQKVTDADHLREIEKTILFELGREG